MSLQSRSGDCSRQGGTSQASFATKDGITPTFIGCSCTKSNAVDSPLFHPGLSCRCKHAVSCWLQSCRHGVKECCALSWLVSALYRIRNALSGCCKGSCLSGCKSGFVLRCPDCKITIAAIPNCREIAQLKLADRQRNHNPESPAKLLANRNC